MFKTTYIVAIDGFYKLTPVYNKLPLLLGPVLSVKSCGLSFFLFNLRRMLPITGQVVLYGRKTYTYTRTSQLCRDLVAFRFLINNTVIFQNLIIHQDFEPS